MIEITIIKWLTMSALILGNIVMSLLAYMMLEEYFTWKGKENE